MIVRNGGAAPLHCRFGKSRLVSDNRKGADNARHPEFILLFGGMGLYISPLFFILLVIVLVLSLGVGYRYRR